MHDYSLLHNSTHDLEGLLRRVMDVARFHPPRWEGRAHTEAVLRELAAMAPPRPMLFIQELISVVTNPIILGLCLPRQADRICAFLLGCSRRVDGLGDVVGASLMDLTHEAGSPKASASGALQRAVDGSVCAVNTDTEKIKQSLLTFCLNYPAFEPPPPALDLIKVSDWDIDGECIVICQGHREAYFLNLHAEVYFKNYPQLDTNSHWALHGSRARA